MNLLTFGAQHGLVGVAPSSGLLHCGRFHFLPTIGAAIPHDCHGNNGLFGVPKKKNAILTQRFSAANDFTVLCR
jgi:hypothetical protein